MSSKGLARASYFYLLLVPFVGAALAFGIGHVSYTIYLPLWLLNACCMTIASWILGLHVAREKNEERSKLAMTAFFLVIPWILISMFAGLGPPPETAAEWTATAKEQQIRYFMLVISGVMAVFGFVGLRERIKAAGEDNFSLLALTAMLIAAPLFVINMLYWGFYLTELFYIQANAGSDSRPDWVKPVRQLFSLVSVTEVALTYFATACIALACRKIGWFTRTSSFFYVLFSTLAFFIIVLSAFFTETLKEPGFAVSIPASPLLMPYFIGVNLLRKIGNRQMG